MDINVRQTDMISKRKIRQLIYRRGEKRRKKTPTKPPSSSFR